MVEDKPTIGIVNSQQEIIEIIGLAVEMAGMKHVFKFADEIKDNPYSFIKMIRDNNLRMAVWEILPPYGTGCELIRKLWSEFEEVRNIPFILTTTHPPSAEKLAQEIGAEIIPRPFDIDQIIDAIQRRSLPPQNNPPQTNQPQV